MDNGAQRLNEVFFYGLYMDPQVLRERGVTPRNARAGRVEGYRLRIGRMATLLRDPHGVAHGMLYALTQDELHALYVGAGLTAYVTEALAVQTAEGSVAALCCNLRQPPGDDEDNPEYRARLRDCMARLGLPAASD